MSELEFEKSILGQTELEKFTLNKLNKISSFDLLEKINWDFKGSKTQYLTHKFHSYPARFIPQIPRTFIKLLTETGDTVLDPFAGCGTTLVEAKLLGRHSIGNDLNPLATLISKVKTTPLSEVQIKRNKLFLDKLNNEIRDHERSKLNLPKMPNRNISNIFTKNMIEEIQIIKKNIDMLKEDEDVFDFNLVALSSTIRAIVESENGDNILQIFKNKSNMMLENIGFEVKKIIFRNIDKSSKYFSTGKIDDEFIVVLQKIKDSKYNNKDDNFIIEIVTDELKKFKENVKKNPGSSTRGKDVTKERLIKNIGKIDDAIQ